LKYRTSIGFLKFTNILTNRCIAGSSKCSTNPLTLLLTNILTVVKEKLQTYCATTYTRSVVNQMWILKNSEELLANLKAQNFSQISSIITNDFSTLYTTIPHDGLKSRLLDIIDNCFYNKNGKRKYSYIRNTTLLNITDSTDKYYKVEIKKMLEFLIDNIYAVVGGQVVQQSVGIPIGTKLCSLFSGPVSVFK
jgi:hypothetical protein